LNYAKRLFNWKRFLLVAILAANAVWIQACGKQDLSQPSCNFVQNSEGQRVSWGGESTAKFYVDKSVPNEYYASIQAAADSWNQKIGHQQIVISGWTDKSGSPSQDGMNVIYFMNTWDANLVNEQARTTIYWSANRITEADILIDAKNFTFSSTGAMPGQVDMQSLVLHEFGHALGLKHVTSVTSVMVPTLAYDYLRRAPQDFDLTSLKCEY
jgi:predicted Zn-dependent protease